MATIGNLVVKIGADISGLSGGIDTARQKIGDLGRTMAGIGAGMAAGSTAPIVAGRKAAIIFGEVHNGGIGNGVNTGDRGLRADGVLSGVTNVCVAHTGRK